MTRSSCPACGCGATREKFVKAGYRIVQCGDCGTLFVTNVPTPEEIAKIYQNGEYYNHKPGTLERIRGENRRRLEWIRGHAAGRRILDVGCASGLFLDQAGEFGYETHGIEQTAHNVEAARRSGHEVFAGTLEDFVARGVAEPFDVVVCLEVVEHVPGPAEFMRQLAACARPGGLVVVSTPNYSGLVARALGSRDPFVIPPEHLNFFTGRGLLALARQSGMRQTRRVTFGSVLPDELDGAVVKYFGRAFAPVEALVKPLIPLSLDALNRAGLGMEMECYFVREGSGTGAAV